MDHYSSRKVAEDYHRTFTEDVKNPDTKKKAIQRYTKFASRVRPGGHILDAGCGTGRFVQYFIKNGFTVTGVDSSSSMIEFAAKNNTEAEFRLMDIRHMDFPSNFFDGIWSVAVLLHLDEFGVQLALQEFRRVLKDDGIMFLATRTNETTLSRIEESTEGGKMTVNYYSRGKMQELLLDSHFEIVEINTAPDDFLRPFDYAYALARPSI